MFQWTEAPTTKIPFFLGYFEDSHFSGPHYQSVVPLQQGLILTSLRENGECDVATMLKYEMTGQFCFHLVNISIRLLLKALPLSQLRMLMTLWALPLTPN